MTMADFNRLSNFIQQEFGIKLSPMKKTMVEGRLQKRLRALHLNSYNEYCEYLFSNLGEQEIVPMMDLVTTNKTDFFREPGHFSLLQSGLLHELTRRSEARPFKVWSAGCSSGEEPYTLAMVLSEYALTHPFPNFHIHATDISTEVLGIATRAVYPEARVADIPLSLRQKYLLKSKDRTQTTVRIAPEIRSKVQFGVLNFMQEHYEAPNDFDIIFCRNVLIYFDKPTQEQVINKLCKHLRKNGLLFLGHSESITNMDVPLDQLKPTVFKKSNGQIF